MVLTFLLVSCKSFYIPVPLNKIDAERKELAQKFAQNFLTKCDQKDYSDNRWL